ncbi:MAG: hypothetical protein ACRD4V_02495 [Candidatus Acidiferrales bacterium]
MSRILIGFVTMTLLCAAPAFANAGGDKDAPKRAKSGAESSATAPKKVTGKAQPAKPENVIPATELQKLQDLIQAQQQELAAQRKALEAQQKELDALKNGSASQTASPAATAQSDAETGAPTAPAAISTTAGSAEVMPARSESSSTATALHATELSSMNRATPAPAPKMASGGATDQPANRLSDLMGGKLDIGATVYAFYSVFPTTGFGPQTLDNTDIYPGPGNNGYNEFNINRTYISIFYTPTPAITFRVTPNIYRETGGTTGEKLSATSGQGGNYNGNYGFRLKYGYIQFNHPFKNSSMFGKDVLVFGQQQQPLTDWEEGLYGYRYVNLTPWNYLSLSSTFVGVRLHGPIEFNGKQYLDYGIGVFNDSSFHAYEVGENKQVMARLSAYPLGAVSKYQGLGITGFVDYGYKDTAIDQTTQQMPELRVAALVHFQSKSGDYGIAGEYDYGRNAFSAGNLFSGSGPADEFGLGPTIYAPFTALTGAILSGTHTRQEGFDFFGHARIAKSPFYLFGMFEQFQPNTNVSTDPIDFRTVIGGIAYHYGKYWQFAVDSKNILYYHSQFTFPVSELAVLDPALAVQYPTGIPNAVPGNTNQVSFNILFNY